MHCFLLSMPIADMTKLTSALTGRRLKGRPLSILVMFKQEIKPHLALRGLTLQRMQEF